MKTELARQILELQAGDHLDGEEAALAHQVQKMETGTLAGGIAHDFNNILNIIQGRSALIASHAGKNGEVAECLKVINEAIERGAGIVQQLLTLAGKGEANLEITDLNAVRRPEVPDPVDGPSNDNSDGPSRSRGGFNRSDSPRER